MCDALAGPDGCPIDPANDFDPEQSFRLPFFVGGGLMVLHSTQLGASRLQPAIVSSPYDSRVAVFWYSQPYRYLDVLPANRQRYWTTVEGVYSTDAAEHFGPLRRILVQPSSLLQDLDAGPGTPIGLGPESINALNANSGLMFDPCLYRVGGDYFFGDYIAGTFLRDSPQQGAEPFAVYATWADSRNGCIQPAMGEQSPVCHQHVFGGAW